MASEAQLSTEFSVSYDGFLVQFDGFDDSMPNYITETFRRMVEMRSEQFTDMFEEVKEELIKACRNSYYDQSF